MAFWRTRSTRVGVVTLFAAASLAHDAAPSTVPATASFLAGCVGALTLGHVDAIQRTQYRPHRSELRYRRFDALASEFRLVMSLCLDLTVDLGASNP